MDESSLPYLFKRKKKQKSSWITIFFFEKSQLFCDSLRAFRSLMMSRFRRQASRKSENEAPNLRNLWFESPLGWEGQAVESEAQVGDFLG